MHKAQTSPAYTQPIQEVVRSWVRGKRAWSGGGEMGKPIMGFLLRLFWGKCFAGMTYHPKEAHAMRDRKREREHSHRSRKECHGEQTDKIVFFV